MVSFSWKTLWTNGWFGGVKTPLFLVQHLNQSSMKLASAAHEKRAAAHGPTKVCGFSHSLSILTPQKCLFWEPGPLLYRFQPLHWRVQGSLGFSILPGSPKLARMGFVKPPTGITMYHGSETEPCLVTRQRIYSVIADVPCPTHGINVVLFLFWEFFDQRRGKKNAIFLSHGQLNMKPSPKLLPTKE